jgi:23S rRNA pseudouridine1911/1915/1917 synthase
MEAHRHEWRVEPDQAGTRLDVAIPRQLPDLSRSRVQALVEEGHILLNGAVPKAGAKLRAGDLIQVGIPEARPVETLPEDIPLDVLYEDADLIVVNKPPGLVVHPGAGNQEHTLVNALLHHCHNLSGIGGELRPGIVHRLDKDTSGALVAAKNDAAHQHLAKQFADRAVIKVYLAVAKGQFPAGDTKVDLAIQRHPVHRQKMQAVTPGVARKADARTARTTFTLLGTREGLSLVKCRLHTGRTHQIRVHLAALGHPIAGDHIYGWPTSAQPPIERQLLHAWKLIFTHPRTGQRLRLYADPPADILAHFPQAGG